MPAKSPWRLKMDEVLADGAWHEYEALRREAFKAVPPGVALRKAERMRLTNARARRAAGMAPRYADERLVSSRSIEYHADVGRRRLALDAIRNALKVGAYESKQEDGKTYVRRIDLPQDRQSA